MTEIKITEKQLEELIDKAIRGRDYGTHYHGMSYEQGIMDTIDFLTGMIDECPLGEIE